MKTRIRQLTEQEKRSLGEQQMIADWLKIFPKGILSIVSDTFDLWKLITEYLPANKDAIMARDGKLVIRPDSGDPVDIICGKSDNIHRFPNKAELYDFLYYCEEHEGDIIEWEDKFYQIEGVKDFIREYGEDTWYQSISTSRPFSDLINGGRIGILDPVKPPKINEPERKGVIELLWDIFGGTTNEQGYKVLDPHIGAIYGDSITPERQVQIYERLAAKGFASTNIVLGVGSFTYQYNTRDTFGFAAKGAWFEVEEEFWASPESLEPGIRTKSYNIYKDPVTDDGTKKSLKGLLCVIKTGPNSDVNQYMVKEECTPEWENKGLLQVIYEDGKFYNQTTLEEIRKRLQ